MTADTTTAPESAAEKRLVELDMSVNEQRLPRRWVRDKDLAEYFGISRPTVWRWVKAGRLPQPVRFSPGCTRFDAELITETKPVNV